MYGVSKHIIVTPYKLRVYIYVDAAVIGWKKMLLPREVLGSESTPKKSAEVIVVTETSRPRMIKDKTEVSQKMAKDWTLYRLKFDKEV